MIMFRKITIFIIVVFLLTNTTKINLAADSIMTASGRVTNVAVIFHRANDPYMMRLRESLQNIEKDANNNIKFTFFDSKNNIAIQNEMLDLALKDNFDLFILNLANKNEDAVESVINYVKQKEAPLILMNISEEVAAKMSKLYNKVAFVAPDSKQAGIAEAKILIDLWNSNKKAIDKNGDGILQYVLLKGKSDDMQAVDRSKFVISEINNAGIKTEQLEIIDAGWLRDLAKTSVSNLFLKYNGRIEAIISNNDAMAVGAIDALQQYGYNKGDKSKNITILGIDGIPEAIDLIDKGFMTGTIIQDANVEAEMFYKIGKNLINNLNPIENTEYKMIDGEILIPFPYNAYIGKSGS